MLKSTLISNAGSFFFQLILSQDYSNSICLSCDARLTEIFEFQKFLIENQNDLYKRILPKSGVSSSELLGAHAEEIFVKTECDSESDSFKGDADYSQGAQSSDENAYFAYEMLEDNIELKVGDVKIQPVPMPEVHVCTTCSREFRSRYFLRKHVSTDHPSILEPGETSTVKKKRELDPSIPRSIRRSNSKRMNLEKLPYENLCSICAKIIKNGRRGFEEHMLRKHSDEFRFFCDLCPKKSKNKWEMIKHMKIHHMLEREHFQCPHCPASFTIKYTRSQHIKSQHRPELGRPYACHCGKSFRTRDHLSYHRRTTHPSAHAFFPCEFVGCDKVFKVKPYLDSHIRDFHGALKKCEFCEKMLRSRKAMVRHLRIHEPPQFKCIFEGCTRAFYGKEALGGHALSVHGIAKEFICKSCGSAFATMKNMKKHEQRVHEALAIECQLSGCKSSFKRRDYLARHYKTHKDIDEAQLDALIAGIKDIRGIAW